MYKRWTVSPFDKEAAASLCACGYPAAVARVAVSRGLTTPEAVSAFLSDQPPVFDPFSLTGIADAVDRIACALEAGEKILIFGDYDCDGVTATALLYEYLSSVGADVHYALPDRAADGYGLNTGAVDRAAAVGISLIVTVDNGINCCEEIAYAASLGIDVVVTDHHIPQQELPEAAALVDPHLSEQDRPFWDLAGVGVAFLLICALSEQEPAVILEQYGDLVAAGTVSDVMPLTGLNRSIVKAGLALMNEHTRPGIAAVFSACGHAEKEITAGSVSFLLAPRINAAGRMGSALPAVRLLLTRDPEEAASLAASVSESNAMRQSVEQEIVTAAAETIEAKGLCYDKIIVVSGSGWHAGVVGIAAAKLVERYGRPVIVLSEQEDRAVGSGRGIAGFSLFAALEQVSDMLIRFGGHELAAGLTVARSDVDLLRRRLNTLPMTAEMPFLTVKSDCMLAPEEATLETASALAAFEPFGSGNPTPVFLMRDLLLEHITPLSGGNHQKLTLSSDGRSLQALLFGVKTEAMPLYEGDRVDLAVTLSVNEFRGSESVSIQIKALRAAGAGGKACEAAVRRYEAYRSGAPFDAAALCPDRNDFAEVYRFLAARPGCPREAVRCALGKKIGFDRTELCLDVLIERGLVSATGKDGVTMLILLPTKEKKNLEDSPLLAAVRQGGVVL